MVKRCVQSLLVNKAIPFFRPYHITANIVKSTRSLLVDFLTLQFSKHRKHYLQAFSRSFHPVFGRKRAIAGGVSIVPAFSLFGTAADKPSRSLVMSAAEEALKTANEHYDANRFDDVYNTLIAHKDVTDNCEIQWKLARAARDVAQLAATPDAKKKELTHEGLQFARNAVKADEKEFSAHKWLGILISDASKFEGYKKQIESAYEIRDEFQKSADLNGKDATSWFLLGEWCYSVADMGWMQRKAASALFGKPPEATWDEALKHFLHAEEVNPGFYVGNMVSLGKTYLKMKNKPEAKVWLTKATEYSTQNEKDDRLIAEAKELLKGL
jgi:tetratricopeptide (TPR) repeat protein